jgi:phosphosulfolactate phosphohydrolase-like enzyme
LQRGGRDSRRHPSSSDAGKAGVNADNTANGPALWASAKPQGRAVVGISTNGVGLWGEVVSGRAFVGAVDTDGTGVWGET